MYYIKHMDSAVRSSKQERNMIVITTTSAKEEAFAQAAMEREAERNVNLNGADFRIERGDYCSIDGIDEATGYMLMTVVFEQPSED